MIHRYKYPSPQAPAGRGGWAVIFGRLLLGYLDDNLDPADVDLIVANPTFPNPERAPRHIERIIEAASKEDLLSTWPFDLGHPRAIVKTGLTPQSAGEGAAAKREAADELRSLLHVPDRTRVEDKRIVVYDDVCTTGSQLDAVAEVLLSNGAAVVEAIVLARAPWRPRP